MALYNSSHQTETKFTPAPSVGEGDRAGRLFSRCSLRKLQDQLRFLRGVVIDRLRRNRYLDDEWFLLLVPSVSSIMCLYVGDAVIEQVRARLLVLRPSWFLIIRAGEVKEETVIKICGRYGCHIPGPSCLTVYI